LTRWRNSTGSTERESLILVGLRHKGREAALRLLYQMELSGDRSDAAIARYWLELPPRLAHARLFAESLVGAVQRHAEKIDSLIDAAAANWQLERIARIDLSILRLGVGELLDSARVPIEIVIDEAVELARAYSDRDAAAFVNGVLDRVARECRPEAKDAR
jgi:transcription antitermination protein NusB